LDVWPASLPISIEVVSRWVSREHEEHLLAALKHKDRVREFHVNGLANHSLERIIAAMEAPYEELTHVSLCCSDPETPPVLPESFLGGSAPNLRSFCLVGISFSSLPRMLLSATNLVYLSVGNIHPSAHLCPQLVVDCLSTLAKLQGLKIHYRSCRERTNRQLPVHPLPATRTIHPALTLFAFMGTSDFLDYLFARVDTPLLKYVDTVLFDPPILDAPRIAQFIGRTETREAFNQAHMLFYSDVVEITLSSREWTSAIGSGDGHTLQVKMSIKFQESHWRVWSLTQGLWASLPPFSEANLARHGTFEDGCVFPSISERAWAKFYFDQISLHWAKVMESAEWLQLSPCFPPWNICTYLRESRHMSHAPCKRSTAKTRQQRCCLYYKNFS
jgi:hypothetical protein